MAKKTIDEIVEEKLPTFANGIKEIKTAEELEKSLVVYFCMYLHVGVYFR